MSTTNIKLFEHNSSRLLFVDNIDPNFELKLEELEQDSSEKDKCNCNKPKFLLGKLTNSVWLLEDSGAYDSNHTHQANINYTDQSDNTETFFNVDRLMEYSAESDHLYTSHGGGLKFVLLDSPIEDQTIELFIKYERTLPGIEQITDLKNNDTGEIYPACIVFYKYNNNVLQMLQIVQLVAGLNVRDNNTLEPMKNINYCSLHVKNALIDFNRLKFTYSIDPNTSNDIKVSFIGTNSLFTNPSLGNYGKFISGRYYENNDNYLEPGFFLIQAPKNRSWICLRTKYGSTNSPGTYYYNVSQSDIQSLIYVYEIKHKDNCKCCYLNKSPLDGYYGNLENNKYVYEINIDRNLDENYFTIMIPYIFTDYESLEYIDNNGNIVSGYMDLGANEFVEENIYNELDGMFYKQISLPIIRTYCKVYKLKITYNKV